MGFGWSDKPLANYVDGRIWVEQVADLIRAKAPRGQAVIAGNSLGGYVSLSVGYHHPDLIKGVVLVNSAGSFDTAEDSWKDASAAIGGGSNEDPEVGPDGRILLEGEEEVPFWYPENIRVLFQKVAMYGAFVLAKQPARITKVLGSVYVNQAPCDEALVRSILLPTGDKNAPDVFRRVVTTKKRTINGLLTGLPDSVRVLLLWGMKDPWCVPRNADRIQTIKPTVDRINVMEAGHCPHDDTPKEVNDILRRWTGEAWGLEVEGA